MVCVISLCVEGAGGQNVSVCMKERRSTELLIGLEKLIQKRTVVFRKIVDIQKLNRYFILRLKSISFLFPFLSWSVCWFHGYTVTSWVSLYRITWVSTMTRSH